MFEPAWSVHISRYWNNNDSWEQVINYRNRKPPAGLGCDRGKNLYASTWKNVFWPVKLFDKEGEKSHPVLRLLPSRASDGITWIPGSCVLSIINNKSWPLSGGLMAQKPCSVIRLSLICPCSVHLRDYRGQLPYPQSPSCSCLIIDIYCLIGWIWTGINTHLDDGEQQ